MLWGKTELFRDDPFELEADLESAIVAAADQLFGPARHYLDIKKKIGAKGGKQNIPDGYLIDLTSSKDPRLYLVEVELAKHDPLKHIAVQILEFSLAFETDPPLVKKKIRDAISSDAQVMDACHKYAVAGGFENVDLLLERMIYGKNRFSALVIIDSLPPDLETVLQSRFLFPVEIVTVRRFRAPDNRVLLEFDPFLDEIAGSVQSVIGETINPSVDPSDIDTIVVPAREEGFEEVFLGQDAWWAIRIHSSMLSKIKFIAAYRVAPESAITHIAPVRQIRPYKDSSKYELEFAAHASAIGPIRLVSGGAVRAPQAPRYTSHARLLAAKSLDQAF